VARELTRILGQLTIEQIKTKKLIYHKFKQYREYRSDIWDFELKENQVNEIDLERIVIGKFVDQVLNHGSKEEKRELIGCLNMTFYLKDRAIWTK